MTDDPAARPAALFPLFASVETLPGIGAKIAKLMAGLDITRALDLVMTLPHSAISRPRVDGLQGLTLPQTVTVEAVIGAHHAPRSPGRPYYVEAEDREGFRFRLVYFRNYGENLAKTLPRGASMAISGKAEAWDNQIQIVHPDYTLKLEDIEEIPRIEPVFPLTKGLSNRVMRKAVVAALTRLPEQVEEWIDPHLLAQEGWPDWVSAVRQAQNPADPDELSPDSPARRRLAYDELFAHQLTLAFARARHRQSRGRASPPTGALTDKILTALPYALTGAQRRAMADISADLAAERRMHRLLQGDVGAGKTVVALLALAMAVEAGGQGVMMAPTEILARQHFSAIAPLAEAVGLRLEILTGRDTGAARRAKLSAMAAGQIDIVLGTHALFSADVTLPDLRLAVIDEQHRFGVAQRGALGAKGAAVDLLVMTATPIPRSLALASFGDLDVSVLDEKPPGRKPIKTALVSQDRIEEVTQHLADALQEGHQAYWVCPLVEESEKRDYTAAEARFAALQTRFGDQVGLVHGQMPAAERDQVMAAFGAGSVRLLVATTVIEVGVDVPNASIMVIERAESFGLAQLHQLRGRVGRGAAQSTCLLLFGAPLTETARKRLTTLRETEDGFRLAEVDLALRGAGDVIGTAQSGLPRFRVADLERQAGLMATAQRDARALLETDPDLESPRGHAARLALHLHDQAQAMGALSAG